MNQPRIFVTYAPTARSAGPVSRSRRAPEPVVAVLAGALLAGGGMHSIGGAQSAGTRLAVASQAPAALPLTANAEPVVLPHLAFLAVLPAERPAPAPQVKVAPKPAAKVAPAPLVKSPRRDLAGFLEDRGLALAAPELEPGLGDIAVEAALEQPAELAKEAVAEAMVPEFAPGEVADRAEAGAETTTAIQTQTFPVIAVAGRPLGAVTMRGDSIHLASLVGLLELKLPGAEFERLRGAPAADSFVSVETLRAAGIDLTVDPDGERISLSAR